MEWIKVLKALYILNERTVNVEDTIINDID